MASNITEGGGYDHEFLSEPPDDLKCLVCLLIAREPWQHGECGKLFCKSCLEEYKKTNETCPNCREEDAQYFKDTKSNRDVQELKIKCVNGHLGCDWTGELNALEKHLTSCPYSLVTCTNKCLTSDGEEYKCLRKKLHRHLKGKCPKRSFKCPHCREEGTHEERTTTHLETCPEVPTKCPNEGCDEELPAKEISNHVKVDCAFTLKECKYRNIGCTTRVMQKDLEAHQGDDKLHLYVAMETLAKQQELLTKLEMSINLVRIPKALPQRGIPTCISATAVSFKLTEYQKRKCNNERIDCPFYTSPNGYCMCLQVYPNGIGKGENTHLSLLIVTKKGNYDDELNWPFIGTMTFELLNQLADKNHHAMKLKIDRDKNLMNDGRGWVGPQFIQHSKLSHDPATITQYLKDDTLYFRVTVEIPEHKPWLEYTAAK